MKIHLMMIMMFLSSILLFSQAPDTLWTRTYGGAGYDYGASVVQTNDGGYIIVGTTTSFAPHDIWLIKTNEFGDTLWTKTFGGNDLDWASSVQQTTDGGYIITGSTNSFAQFNQIWLIKTDEQGDTLWTKIYGYGWGYSVRQTNDAGYIITGKTWSPSFDDDIYLIKTDDVGDTIWTKRFGTGSDEEGNSVEQTIDGGYIVLGNGLTINGSQIWLIKTDYMGDTLWVKSFQEGVGHCLQQTNDGGYVITGDIYYGNERNNEVILIKTNPAGDINWQKTYWGSRGFCVQQTVDGGYIVIGETAPPYPEDFNICILKTNINGDTSWTKILNGEENDWGRWIQQTVDGGYILTGFTASYGSGDTDIWLIRLEADIPVNINDKIILSPDYFLISNYPNPFNPSTTFRYSIPRTSKVIIKIFDVLGTKIETLVSEEKPVGTYELYWNAEILPSGVYFYRLQAGSFVQTRKMILLR